MTNSLKSTRRRASEEDSKGPEERILEGIFGVRPTSSEDGADVSVTPDSVQKDFASVLTSLDRSEARMRVLQAEMWMNRREIETRLERIRTANDRNEAALSTLALNG